ncbi:hypothetical protein [Kutzneria kofuensis]|uniref:Uncharacterized protein n=1 Tax=Kutzneria kofuensis TaxID=103725 RepID=A0A7W9NFZ4_9PSEU|nr:hypothetical protein [Kutzneria kofuensis]MBB5891009.1 hypothetical protein [Kutzneria kofuensis]
MNDKDNTDQPAESKWITRLRKKVTEAEQAHGLMLNPYARATSLRAARKSITRCMWLFLGLGIAFNASGVQATLAGNRDMADPQWWAYWLLEPALGGLLITVLRWEAKMHEERKDISGDEYRAARRLKWLLMAFTLTASVLASRQPGGALWEIDPGQLLVHVLFPVVTYLVAEVMPLMMASFADVIADAEPTDPAPTPAPGPATPVTAASSTVVVEPTPQPHPQEQQPTTAQSGTQSPVPAPVLDEATPANIRAQVEALHAEIAPTGRAVTVTDLIERLRYPESYARKILIAPVAATNGHH